MGQSGGTLEKADETLLAQRTQLGGSDIVREQVKRPFARRIELTLKAGEHADKQIVKPRQALGLGIDQIAAPANHESDLEGDLAGCENRPEIRADADCSAMVCESRGSDLFSPPTVP